jgi:hypothetical protein
LQEASQDVLKDESAKISDVGVVVDRWSAGIDANFALVNRLERLKAVRERVMQANSVVFCAHWKSVILSEASVCSKGGVQRGFSTDDQKAVVACRRVYQ